MCVPLERASAAGHWVLSSGTRSTVPGTEKHWEDHWMGQRMCVPLERASAAGHWVLLSGTRSTVPGTEKHWEAHWMGQRMCVPLERASAAGHWVLSLGTWLTDSSMMDWYYSAVQINVLLAFAWAVKAMVLH
jgi:hypothetical protein